MVSWGSNQQGQSSVPATLSGVVAIAAGFYASFALSPQASSPQVTITAVAGIQGGALAGALFSVSGDGCQPGSYATPQTSVDAWLRLHGQCQLDTTRTIIAPSASATYTATPSNIS